MPDYTLLPFPIFQGHCFFVYLYAPDAFTSAIHPQNLISYFNTDRLAPIERLYSLHQSALVRDQNCLQILGPYT